MSRHNATKDISGQTEWFPVPRKIVYVPNWLDDGRVHGEEPRYALIFGRYPSGRHFNLVTTDGILDGGAPIIAYCHDGEYIFNGHCYSGRAALNAALKRAHAERAEAIRAENEVADKWYAEIVEAAEKEVADTQ
jgi:hypothetical protein